jgi:hypothetical protein
MVRVAILLSGLAVISGAGAASAADSVMVQCGREYQAARTAGTLNGADWSRFRTDCAARLKGEAAGATAAAVPAAAAPAVAAPVAAAPATPAAVPASAAATPAASGGMAAMHARQKQCGAEWRAQKATLVAQTPGLTWPRYWSQCNTRLKAAK